MEQSPRLKYLGQVGEKVRYGNSRVDKREGKETTTDLICKQAKVWVLTLVDPRLG